MKLAAKLSLAGGVVVVLAGLALPVSNLIVGGPSGTALTRQPAADPQLGRVAGILEKKCGYCHVGDASRPFYSKLPVAGGMIDRDVKEGLEGMDLATELFPAQGPVSEAALAKIERELEEGAMPPAKYLALHWNGELTAGERDAVLGWLRGVRATAHAAPGAPEALRSALIRPLPASVPVDARKVALGDRLYHDKRLSGDGTVSCATCHDLAKGGTDQAVVSTGIRGQKGGINSPTTFNSGLQFMQFWDGRATTLEDQAAGPPANPIEMGATWDQIVQVLAQDTALAAEMQAVYPDGVTQANVTDAIAEFERTLLTPGSKLDRFLLGDAGALSPEERQGHDAFLERGCGTCHVGELLGGRSFERMGRRADYFAARGHVTEADHGRFAVTRREADRHRFKVPTLRNVARTFPYFHDGSQATLRDAVVAMARYQLGVTLPDAEAAAMVKFLEALTGEYQGKPL